MATIKNDKRRKIVEQMEEKKQNKLEIKHITIKEERNKKFQKKVMEKYPEKELKSLYPDDYVIDLKNRAKHIYYYIINQELKVVTYEGILKKYGFKIKKEIREMENKFIYLLAEKVYWNSLSNKKTIYESMLEIIKDYGIDKKYAKELEEEISNVGKIIGIQENEDFKILDNIETPVFEQIKEEVNEINLKEIKLAIGYLFRSGDELLKYLGNNNLKKTKIIIGSLQNYIKYNEKEEGNKISTMDKNTAKYLNSFEKNKLLIRTYEKEFYHGKLYIFKGEKETVLVMGSSNISKAGLKENIELNTIKKYQNNSVELKKWLDWYNELWMKSSEIEMPLNEELFVTNEYQNSLPSYIKASDGLENSIMDEITEEEIKKRMKLLFKQNPYEKIIFKEVNNMDEIIDKDFKNKISKSFKDCVLLAYRQKDGKSKVIIEGLKEGNAIYFIYGVENLKELISEVEIYQKNQFQKNLKNKGTKVNKKNHTKMDGIEKEIETFFNI